MGAWAGALGTVVVACSGSSAGPANGTVAASDDASMTESDGASNDASGSTTPDASNDTSQDAPADALAIIADGEAGSMSATDAAGDAAGCVDADNDGYFASAGCGSAVDCDDTNPFVNPGMLELADDGLDNDCAGGDLTAAAGPGLYVNGGAAGCSDADANRGSKAIPYCTIAHAVADATSATGTNVFVAAGTYSTALNLNRVPVSLFGGYDGSSWAFSPTTNVTTIGGASTIADIQGNVTYTWLNIEHLAAGVAVQGFAINGGSQTTPNQLLTVQINGEVTLAKNVIAGGQGPQTIGVYIEQAGDVTFLANTIAGGSPATGNAYGVENVGTAVLWGNRIDGGPGATPNVAIAVQNYGTIGLFANVINASAAATKANQTIGFSNVSDSSPAVALVFGNTIFGGQGSNSSYAVYSYGTLALVDTIAETRGYMATVAPPHADAVVLYGAGSARLANNDLALDFSGEDLVYAPVEGGVVDVQDIAKVNACGAVYEDCAAASGNVAAAPGFVDAGLTLASGSACRGAGVAPTSFADLGVPIAFAYRDANGAARPGSGWDIGAYQTY